MAVPAVNPQEASPWSLTEHAALSLVIPPLTPAPVLLTSERTAAQPSNVLATQLQSQVPANIAAGKASQSPSASAAAAMAIGPESSADVVPTDFDGRQARSEDVLERADRRNLNSAVIGEIISQSKSIGDVVTRLTGLGLLTPSQTLAAHADEEGARILVTRLWTRTAPFVAAPFPIDNSWGVPALKVSREGVVYLVHAVHHGSLVARRQGVVRRLVKNIAAAGHALYAEQNLPFAYGYRYGRETLDHHLTAGGLAMVVPAADGRSNFAFVLNKALSFILRGGAIAFSSFWLYFQPSSPMAWLTLTLSTFFALAIATESWRKRAFLRRLATKMRQANQPDLAAHLEDEAASKFSSTASLEARRGLELPGSLRAENESFSIRSRAIADAVAADAAARGAAQVHLIVGAEHAHETAWRLAHPEERRS